MKDVGVFLRPEDRELNKWGAAGLTNEEGKAVLKTSSAFEGVVPGTYVISFKKHALQTGTSTPPSLIPERYTLGKSRETITVTEGRTEYLFELEGLERK